MSKTIHLKFQEVYYDLFPQTQFGRTNIFYLMLNEILTMRLQHQMKEQSCKLEKKKKRVAYT